MLQYYNVHQLHLLFLVEPFCEPAKLFRQFFKSNIVNMSYV